MARRDLKFVILSLKAVSEEFVVRSLRASPLMKPFLTPGGWPWLNVCTDAFQSACNVIGCQGSIRSESYSFRYDCVEKCYFYP